MMDWTLAIEQERAALMRIVALLCSLAGLAERAATRSPAIRGFVLWILRRAEAVARDFVADPEARLAVEPAGARPADAIRLAASLRRLARQLRWQIGRQARLMRGDGSAGTQPPTFSRMPAIRDIATALSMLTAVAWLIPHPAPDTS
jgi:hypothetical protein